MSDEKILQQFVDSFQRLDDMYAPEVTPLELIVNRDDIEGWDSWEDTPTWQPIHVDTRSDALNLIYPRIAGQFPLMYERLILSYRWLEVDLQIVRLFANPPGTVLTGLADAIFGDRIMADILIPAGFVPFARAPDYNYDPICFNLNALTLPQDCPIIQFEHESILCHLKIGEQWTRWESFQDLMTEVIWLDA